MKRNTVNWLTEILNKPAFPCSPQQATLHNRADKQPCYYEGKYLKSIEWKQYQDWHNIDIKLRKELISKWHKDSRIEGVSTLGGWNGKHYLCWIDFDIKDGGREKMISTIQKLLEDNPVLNQAHKFHTPSGGYRILVASETNPETEGFKSNSGFNIIAGSKERLGEILAKNGGHTLLPPSIGVNGQAYRWQGEFNPCYPVIVSSLATLGLYPIASIVESYQPSPKPYYNAKSDVERAREYLAALSPSRADNYDEWLKVGWALHSVSDELLVDWDNWSRGSSKYKSGECDRLWTKHFKATGGITIATLYTMAKQDGYQYIPKQKPTLIGQPKIKVSNKVLSNDEVTQHIDNGIREKLNEFQWELKLKDLERRSDYKLADLRELKKTRILERDRKIDKLDQVRKFLERAYLKKDTLAVEDILPPRLARKLKERANEIRQNPLRLLHNLWGFVGSVLGSRAYVAIRETANGRPTWSSYPIFYTADVDYPSGGKSLTQRAIYESLQDADIREQRRAMMAEDKLPEVKARWEDMTKDEKDAHRHDPEYDPAAYKRTYCVARRLVFDKPSPEAMFKSISQQPFYAGSVSLQDELSGMFQGMDQYKGGKGDSRQLYLEAWNGPLKTSFDRVDQANSYRLSGQTLSLAGGIQYEIMQKYLDVVNDYDGLVSRFLFLLNEPVEDFAKWYYSDLENNDLYDELADIKAIIESCINPTYSGEELQRLKLRYSPDAQRLFIKAWEHYRRIQLREQTRNPSFSSYVGKMIEYITRIAMVLHILDWCENRKQGIDLYHIETKHLSNALKLVDHYLNQFLLIQNISSGSTKGKDGSSTLHGVLAKVWDMCRNAGKVSCRDIYRKFRKIDGETTNVDKAMDVLRQLEQSGYGFIEGNNLIYQEPKQIEVSEKDLTVSNYKFSETEEYINCREDDEEPAQAQHEEIDYCVTADGLHDIDSVGVGANLVLAYDIVDDETTIPQNTIGKVLNLSVDDAARWLVELEVTLNDCVKRVWTWFAYTVLPKFSDS